MPALSLTTVKAHLRVDNASDDTLIQALIDSAVGLAEHITGRTFDQRSRTHRAADFGGYVALPGAPVTEVTEVKYLDAAGVEQTLPSGDYVLESGDDWPAIVPGFGTCWPAVQTGRSDAVRVTYAAGYGATESDVPAAIRQWLLLAIGTWYNLRESVAAGASIAELPRGAWDALLDPYLVDLGV
jgi:uncharacterized phiE125 gp8 family phage protein